MRDKMDADPARAESETEIVRGRKLAGRVAGLYSAQGRGFETSRVDALDLDLDGIPGDVHGGSSRRSGGREPWYPRGTVMRNERQVSIVGVDEMAEIARRMALPEIQPEWIGANLLLDGLPRLSMIPAGTLLFFEGGVTIKVDSQNAPCRSAGRALARNAGMADLQAGEMLFPKVARRLRGLVGWVEKPGRIEAGESLSARIPEQWIYRP